MRRMSAQAAPQGVTGRFNGSWWPMAVKNVLWGILAGFYVAFGCAPAWPGMGQVVI